jgi:hypothetical protein
MDQVYVSSEGGLSLLDPGHKRIVFLTDTEEGLNYLSEVRFDLIPVDYCIVEDRIFVTALHEGKLIHEFNLDGQLLRSFAEPIRPETSTLKENSRWRRQVDLYSIRGGELICSKELQMVILVPGALPQVRAYSLEGLLAWTHRLTPFDAPRWSETSEGRFRMGWDPDVGSMQSSTTAWVLGRGRVAIHLVRTGPGRDPLGAVTELRFLDLTTGELTGRQSGLPRIAGYIGGDIVAWESLPFPRVYRQGARFTASTIR